MLAAVDAEASAANGTGVVRQPPAPREPAGEAPPPGPPSPRRRPNLWARRLGFGLAGAAALAIAVFAGTRVAQESAGPGAPVEIQGTLLAPNGEGDGDVLVNLLGTGRQVDLESSSLPILPTGEYYELWFVGPGDRPDHPNRISAGTFHPDERGDANVVLHAAVDPSKYPLIEVTAEPGDGDPAATGDVALRLDSARLLGD